MPGGKRPRRCRRPVLTGLLACVALQVCLPLARAADRLYYSSDANTIRWTNLDGPFAAGGQVTTGAATVNAPQGIAIDSTTGRIYWANNGADKISYAALDGSGGADLSITPTGAVSGPYGLGINPVSRRLYWANATGNNLASAALDGSAAAVLPNAAAATHTNPTGVAVDPVFNRLYWANRSVNKITRGSTTPSGGSGDSDISTGTATVNGPTGVALDTDQATAGATDPPGRIYWTNLLSTKISYAALDGSTAGDLSASGAPVSTPRGIAVDPAAGLIYWANDPTTGALNISYAHLDGSGGGVAAPADHPRYIALLQTPRPTGAPTVTGGGDPGATLTCSSGSWAGDVNASFLFRAPHTLAYQWTRDGTDVPGATAGSYTAQTAGAYRCVVTAANAAGTAAQTSDPHAVTAPATTATGTDPGTGTPPASGSEPGLPPAVLPAASAAVPHARLTRATVDRRRRHAAFAFTATGPVSGYRCALVGPTPHATRRPTAIRASAFRRCRSPKAFAHLRRGHYTFAVRAFNAAGSDQTPTVRAFTI